MFNANKNEFQDSIRITARSVLFFIGACAGIGSVVWVLAVIVDKLFIHINNPWLFAVFAAITMIPVGIYIMIDDLNSNIRIANERFEYKIKVLEISNNALLKLTPSAAGIADMVHQIQKDDHKSQMSKNR